MGLEGAIFGRGLFSLLLLLGGGGVSSAALIHSTFFFLRLLILMLAHASSVIADISRCFYFLSFSVPSRAGSRAGWLAG